MADPSTSPVVVESSPKGNVLMGMLLAALFIVVVVVIELTIAYFVFPSAEDTQQLAQEMMAANAHDSTSGADSELPQESEEHGTKEVDLGRFDVSSFQPLSNTTLRISAHVYGTLAEEDEEAFHKLFEEKQQRIREHVVVILRNAELGDLTDAGLGLIKRKILETTNRTLGKQLLRQIIISEISFLEQ
jgi:flagellar FliL protein